METQFEEIAQSHRIRRHLSYTIIFS